MTEGRIFSLYVTKPNLTPVIPYDTLSLPGVLSAEQGVTLLHLLGISQNPNNK